MMQSNDKIFIAGHRGLVGSAILKQLNDQGFNNLCFATHDELDLCDAEKTKAFFEREKPKYVFLCAAKVGGIIANRDYPVEFIRDNLAIQQNVITCAHQHQVTRLLFLGSSCIYPKMAPQPMSESDILTGPLEFTNRPYALAKIAGIEMCSAYNRQFDTQFLAAMPTNLYGPNDNYDLQHSHVLPALIRKCHEAKVNQKEEITLWGTGSPRREFLYSADLADACVFLMTLPDEKFKVLTSDPESHPLINIGFGSDITIMELAELIKSIINFTGDINWDHNKPDGTPRKLLNSDKLKNLGWTPSTPLKQGIESSYRDFLKKNESKKKQPA
jgi:GDP-L-fucose synthase